MLSRSFLICNGLRSDHMQKAATSSADVVMLELEDGVPGDRKDEALDNVVHALSYVDWGGRAVYVRVEHASYGRFSRDVERLIPARPDGVVLAKVRDAGDVTRAEEEIRTVEAAAGIELGTTRLALVIEDASGFLSVEELARSSPRISMLLAGEGDLELALGYRHLLGTDEAYGDFQPYLLHVRSRIIFAAHAAGAMAISAGVPPSGRAGDALHEHYRFLYQLGFDGVSVGSPRGADVANVAFAPSPAELAFAAHVMNELERVSLDGLGVAGQPDGSFIGEVSRGPAQRVLDLQRAVERRAHASTTRATKGGD